MLMREKEINNIETIGALRAVLADVPDDMAIFNMHGYSVDLHLIQDHPNAKFYIEVM